jgi:hypothetical protein
LRRTGPSEGVKVVALSVAGISKRNSFVPVLRVARLCSTELSSPKPKMSSPTRKLCSAPVSALIKIAKFSVVRLSETYVPASLIFLSIPVVSALCTAVVAVTEEADGVKLAARPGRTGLSTIGAYSSIGTCAPVASTALGEGAISITALL